MMNTAINIFNNTEEIKREQQLARENQIQRLKTQGIEPTEENIKKLAQEDEEITRRLLDETHRKETAAKKDRIQRSVGLTVFDTVEEAEKYRTRRREVGKKVDLIQKVYDNCYIHELPIDVLSRIQETVKEKNQPLSESFELMLKFYLLGKVDGKREERARRKQQ